MLDRQDVTILTKDAIAPSNTTSNTVCTHVRVLVLLTDCHPSRYCWLGFPISFQTIAGQDGLPAGAASRCQDPRAKSLVRLSNSGVLSSVALDVFFVLLSTIEDDL